MNEAGSGCLWTLDAPPECAGAYTKPQQDAFAATIATVIAHESYAKKDEDFAQIPAKSWFRLVNNRQLRFRARLIRDGLLESDRSYSTLTGKSIGYRVGPIFDRVAVFGYRPQGVCLRKKLRERDARRQKQLDDLPPDYRALADVIVERLTIDHDKASQLCLERDGRRRRSAMLSVARIAARDWSFKADPRGRFYSNVTNTPSEIRQTCLIGDGDPLYETDIANSQPLILSGLVDGADDFRRLCERGVLYDVLAADAFSRREDPRGDAKAAMQNYLFTKKRKAVNVHLRAAMTSRFPVVADYVEHAYRDTAASPLWDRLQRTEAALMIPAAARLVRSGVFAATCHDSLLVSEPNIEKAKAAILDAFGEIGLKPNLRAKG